MKNHDLVAALITGEDETTGGRQKKSVHPITRICVKS